MSKLKLAAAASAIAVVAFGSVAFGAIPDGNGVIQGCYGKPGTGWVGMLRVVDGDQTSCTSGELPVDWNQAGQPGAPGEKGDKGDTGDPGPQGPSTYAPVFVKRVDEVKLNPGPGGAAVLVASLSLPQGIYRLMVTGIGSNWGTLDVLCTLYANTKAGVPLGHTWIEGDALIGSFGLTDLVGGAGTIDLYCESVGEADEWVANVRMVATSIGELNTQI
jgi:hypothetical protein